MKGWIAKKSLWLALFLRLRWRLLVCQNGA
jgi:hypothetical protein